MTKIIYKSNRNDLNDIQIAFEKRADRINLPSNINQGRNIEQKKKRKKIFEKLSFFINSFPYEIYFCAICIYSIGYLVNAGIGPKKTA